MLSPIIRLTSTLTGPTALDDGFPRSGSFFGQHLHIPFELKAPEPIFNELNTARRRARSEIYVRHMAKRSRVIRRWALSLLLRNAGRQPHSLPTQRASVEFTSRNQFTDALFALSLFESGKQQLQAVRSRKRLHLRRRGGAADCRSVLPLRSSLRSCFSCQKITPGSTPPISRRASY